MSAYVGILKMQFKSELQYRTKALSGLLTQIFWGFLRISLFTAFLTSASIDGFSIPQMCSYIWLGQAFLAAFYIGLPKDIHQDIVGGNICYKFIRPMDMYNQWFMGLTGMKVAAALLRCFPILILGFCLPSYMGLMAPVSVAAFVLFLISLCVGVAMSVAITLFAIYLSLKTLMPRGAAALVMSITALLNGSLIPIPMMPVAFQKVLNFLPFRYMSDLPYRIYIGNLSIQESCVQIAISLAWLIAMILIGKLCLKSSLRKVVVQGG